eukprot:TRINITY_DN6824_c4_g1_i1.p1 TRINITY_DN6824_c4_g1~~TRINITY_DN6824_c4_g1_i1.p1  ORF type:complete len:561 (+),score=73.57 TRINITY_DN6824_c4_g1_i1:48-1730(+)
MGWGYPKSLIILLFACQTELVVTYLIKDNDEYRVSSQDGKATKPRISSFTPCGYVTVWDDGPVVRGQIVNCDGGYGENFEITGTHGDVSTNNDGFLVIWKNDGTISGQLFTPNGIQRGQPFKIPTQAYAPEREPCITTLTNTNYVIVWQGPDGSGYGILAQLYASDGTEVGTIIRVSTTTEQHQITPSVAALPSGGFIVVWLSNSFDGVQFSVYGQRFTAAGIPINSEFQINTITDGTRGEASITALPSGGFVAVWFSTVGVSDDADGISAQVFGPGGEKLGVEIQVNPSIKGSQYLPDIAPTETGFIVVWESEHRPTTSYDVYGQEFSANGSPVGSEFQINKDLVTPQQHVRIARYSNGYYVLWQSEGHIFGQNYLAAGITLPLPVEINNQAIYGRPLSGRNQISIASMTLSGIPETFVQGTAYVPNLPVSVRSDIQLTCTQPTACHFFVSVYHCEQCGSFSINGGLNLLSLDPRYDVSSCAPQFKSNNIWHRMISFHTEVSSGSSVSVPATTKELRYAVIFEVSESQFTENWCHKPKGPHRGNNGKTCREYGCPSSFI